MMRNHNFSREAKSCINLFRTEPETLSSNRFTVLSRLWRSWIICSIVIDSLSVNDFAATLAINDFSIAFKSKSVFSKVSLSVMRCFFFSKSRVIEATAHRTISRFCNVVLFIFWRNCIHNESSSVFLRKILVCESSNLESSNFSRSLFSRFRYPLDFYYKQ